MKDKLLVICGPTATGKTSLGIRLAKIYGGEIVSADSRQVYIGMDIGTGKERSDEIKIHAYDLVDPKSEFSVGQYLKIVGKIIRDIKKRGKLPIIVGGTGLYIKGIIDGIPTANVPKNKRLRKNLELKNVVELFEMLGSLDSLRAGSMNSSDRKNPSRLIRAIEISQYNLMHGQLGAASGLVDVMDVLTIGLTAPLASLTQNVEKNIEGRIEKGIKKEIQSLLSNGVDWHNQSMMSLGYRQWRDYFEADVEEEQVIAEWKKEERQYVKRQLTWFKKDKRVIWFDITSQKYPKNVEKMVKKWYAS